MAEVALHLKSRLHQKYRFCTKSPIAASRRKNPLCKGAFGRKGPELTAPVITIGPVATWADESLLRRPTIAIWPEPQNVGCPEAGHELPGLAIVVEAAALCGPFKVLLERGCIRLNLPLEHYCHQWRHKPQ